MQTRDERLDSSALFFERGAGWEVEVDSEGGEQDDFLIFRQTQYEFTICDLRFTISGMNTETAYNLALDYLYSFVDYSLKHSSELAKADFNLERMFALMESNCSLRRHFDRLSASLGARFTRTPAPPALHPTPPKGRRGGSQRHQIMKWTVASINLE